MIIAKVQSADRGVSLRQEPPFGAILKKSPPSQAQVVFFQNFLTPSAQPIKIKGNNHKPLKFNQYESKETQQTWIQILR